MSGTALATLADTLLDLHKPTWTVNGKTYTNRVLVSEEDMTPELRLRHKCVPEPDIDACIPGEDHYVEACNECRHTTQEGEEGYLLWPCPTARAVEAAVTPSQEMAVAADVG